MEEKIKKAEELSREEQIEKEKLDEDDKKFYEREKKKLPYNLVAYINDVFGDWLSNIPVRNYKPDMSKFKDFNDYRDTFIRVTNNYFKKKYPNVKYQILDYKKSVEMTICTANKFDKLPPEMYDTIAFKLNEKLPEVYLLISDEPMMLDEYSFNAYEGNEGAFVRPDWKFD